MPTLEQQSRLPLPAIAREGIEAFNRGEYFEQHELLEAAWRAEAGPVRELYQGVLQVGVAYLQIERHNYLGARKIFARALRHLAVLPDVCQGIDVARLRTDARAAQAELERLGATRIAEFERKWMKPVIRHETSDARGQIGHSQLKTND
jgi:predicted metal-dependent hydrolase